MVPHNPRAHEIVSCSYTARGPEAERNSLPGVAVWQSLTYGAGSGGVDLLEPVIVVPGELFLKGGTPLGRGT